jgi:phenylpyruvate tautomerase PptA (4-oxalocrotonate tautomerase family)
LQPNRNPTATQLKSNRNQKRRTIMPFARISLLKGKSPEYLRTLSDSVHQALVDAYEVPADDRFQAIQQHEANELIFDRNYMAGPRSDNYVLIEITAGRPRTTETKQGFYRRTVELLQRNLDMRPADVMIVISTSQRDEWSFGNGLTQMLDGPK